MGLRRTYNVVIVMATCEIASLTMATIPLVVVETRFACESRYSALQQTKGRQANEEKRLQYHVVS